MNIKAKPSLLMRRLFILVILAAGAVTIRFFAQKQNEEPIVHNFPIFGTYGRLTAWGNDRNKTEHALQTIVDELQELNDCINIFDPQSELSRLNKTAYTRPVVCSPRLWDALHVGRIAHERTNGTFDITIGPLMKLWGFHQKRKTYPSETEVQSALAAVGLETVEFDNQRRTVRFTHPDTYFDLGGIAKGYGLDLAAEIARSAGISQALFDLGGNIYCFSDPPPNQTYYRIGIQDPQASGEILEVVKIRGAAVATSGNYENSLELDGRLVHHLIDPRTGYPVPDVASVTVITPVGTDSDVFSTAVFVGGGEAAESFIENNPGSSILRIVNTPAGTERHTHNWPPDHHYP